MAALIMLSVMAAFGVLCALWILFGFLVADQRGASTVCLCRSGIAEEPVIRRYLWLYNTGLIRSPLLLVDCGLTEQERTLLLHHDNIILCTAEDLLTLLEQEREYLDRTRT